MASLIYRNPRQTKGGDKAAADMLARYRAVYKNRRAMVEILGKL
jgi:hypothetical protein